MPISMDLEVIKKYFFGKVPQSRGNYKFFRNNKNLKAWKIAWNQTSFSICFECYILH